MNIHGGTDVTGFTSCCCAPETSEKLNKIACSEGVPVDKNTIDYQLQRLAGGVVEGRRLLKIIGSQLFGPINTDECERNKPATVADAMSVLADDLVVMGKELAKINEAVSRQLGNWRLE